MKRPTKIYDFIEIVTLKKRSAEEHSGTQIISQSNSKSKKKKKKTHTAAVLVLQSSPPSQMHQLDSWPRQQVAVEAFLVHGWLHKFSNTSQWPPPHRFSPWGYSNRTSLLWFTQMHKFCLLGTTPAVNTSLIYLWVLPLSKMSLPKYIRMYY